MTFTRVEVVLFLVAVLNVLAMLELVRRRRMREKYALLWLAVGAVGIAVSLLRDLVDAAASAVGIAYGPTLLFVGALMFLLFVCVQLSLEVSRLRDRTTLLAQEVALLRVQTSPGGNAS